MCRLQLHLQRRNSAECEYNASIVSFQPIGVLVLFRMASFVAVYMYVSVCLSVCFCAKRIGWRLSVRSVAAVVTSTITTAVARRPTGCANHKTFLKSTKYYFIYCQQRNRTCRNHSGNCLQTPVELYYVDTFNTTSMEIQCSTVCVEDESKGLRRILIWATDVTDGGI